MPKYERNLHVNSYVPIESPMTLSQYSFSHPHSHHDPMETNVERQVKRPLFNLEMLNKTERSSTELFIPRDRNLFAWNHLTFFCILMLEEDGTVVRFLDFYFKWVNRELPLLSKDWINRNLAEMPLYLLHAMYSYCLIFPAKNAVQPVTTQAHRSYIHARTLVMQNLELADPFMLCALLQ